MGIEDLLCDNIVDAREKLLNIELQNNIIVFQVSKIIDLVKSYDKAFENLLKIEDELMNSLTELDPFGSESEKLKMQRKMAGNTPIEQESILQKLKFQTFKKKI